MLGLGGVYPTTRGRVVAKHDKSSQLNAKQHQSDPEAA